MMNLSIILFVILVIINGLDVYTTVKILDQGGREVNPVMDWLMDRIGIKPALFLSKIVVLVLIGVMVLLYGWHVILPIILALLCGVYVYVVRNNFRHVK